MRHLALASVLVVLASVSACDTPSVPADTGAHPDVGGDGSRPDAATDGGRDANIHDVGMHPDAIVDDGGFDAGTLDGGPDGGDDAGTDGGLDGGDDAGTDAATSDGGCTSSAACDDSNGCTTDTCTSGACSHAPRSIDDSNPCTTDACDSSTGTITHVPLASIDDANACTTDSCSTSSGAITHAPISGIDDSNVCTTDSCNTSSGAISHAPIAGCCNVGSECTSGVCQSHACVSAQCNDGIRNGTETDRDCGGSCGPCALGLMCVGNADCSSHACSSGGICVGCNTPSDCGTDTACQMHTCNANTCGVSNVAMGTSAGTQTTGDCHRSQCDGNGNITNAIDDTDVPTDDGNQCTSEICTTGVATHPPVVPNTACSQGGGSVCNGAGTCAQCNTATQCPGTDTECHTRTCSAGACGVNNVASGTLTSAQTSGDCQQNQCDGTGNIVSATDNTDAPADDGNQCTSDVCISGAPMHPAVMPGNACSQSGGVECNGTGACVQCLVASDCGTDTACATHTCTAGACGVGFTMAGFMTSAQTTGDCHANECDGSGNITPAIDNTDLPVDGNQCTSDVCTAGVGSNPPVAAGTACSQSGGTACDGAGSCVIPPTPPTVTSTTPADAATAIAVNPSIAITFSAAMNPATLTAQTALGACSGSIQVSLDNFATCVAFASSAPTMSGGNTTATLTAAPGLLVNRTYKIRVTTAATNATGTALAATYTQTTGFTTGGVAGCGGTGVVIAQAYGGGGNTGSVWKNDFVVLHNRGTVAVNLTGWSVQYTSATGTGTWSVTGLTGTIQPGGFFLVQEAAGTGGTTSLPTADTIGTIAMGAGGGKVALVNNMTALSGACPTGAQIVDLVGMSSAATCSETAPTGTPGNTTAVLRAQAACTDSNNNSTDFTVGTPSPLNTSSATMSCGCTQNESGAAAEADYCTTQFPLSLSVQTGMMSAITYGQIYEAGTTEAAGASASVLAQLGYGPVSVNPEYEYGWVWASTTYNAQSGNNDEYRATFTAPAVGTYRYGYRFSLDAGASWTYCDNNQADSGAGSNVGLTFDLTNLGVLTVTP